MPSSSKPGRSNLLWFIAILGVIAVLVFISFPWNDPLVEGRRNVSLRECRKNLKNLGTALEMYSTDWAGQFPQNLEKLTPDYIREMPQCLAVDRDTYSQTYRVGELDVFGLWCPDQFTSPKEACHKAREQLKQELQLTRERTGAYPKTLSSSLRCPVHNLRFHYTAPRRTYSFHCQGSHHVHQEVPENFPQYDGIRGLRLEP